RRREERVEARVAVVRFDGRHEPVPTDVHEDHDRHDDEADAHHDELQEVRHEHREHAAEDRVDRDADEENRHRDLEVADVESADEHEELAPRPQEHTHVQEAAEDDYNAGRPSYAGAEGPLDELRHGDDSRVPQRLDAEASDAYDEHRDRHQD